MAEHVLSGRWIYRSFYYERPDFVRALPDPAEQAKRALGLLWAEGVALFEAPSPDGSFVGKMIFRPAAPATEGKPASPEIALAMKGNLESDGDGNPTAIDISGVGPTIDPRNPWKYSIKGWFVDKWAASPTQGAAFVGSVVNTEKIEAPPPAGAELGTVGAFMLVRPSPPLVARPVGTGAKPAKPAKPTESTTAKPVESKTTLWLVALAIVVGALALLVSRLFE